MTLSRFLVAAIVLLLFSAVVLYTAYHGVTDSPVTNMLIGALISSFTGVVNWFFGSSVQSSSKDQTIAQSVQNTQTALNAPTPIVAAGTPGVTTPKHT